MTFLPVSFKGLDSVGAFSFTATLGIVAPGSICAFGVASDASGATWIAFMVKSSRLTLMASVTRVRDPGSEGGWKWIGMLGDGGVDWSE